MQYSETQGVNEMRKTVTGLVILIMMVALPIVPRIYASGVDSVKDSKVTKSASEIYVYIKEGGKRYHKKNCSVVPTGKTRVTLQEAVDRGYTPCKVCNPPVLEEIRVWVNPEGKKYHLKECRMVQEDAVEMSLTEALEKGYTPCKICKPPEKGDPEDKEEGEAE
jgi:hypothetical protein